MKILHLILKEKWYDMIASGEKTEEYRTFNPYWCNRLIEKNGIRYWNEKFKNNSIGMLSGMGKDGNFFPRKPLVFGFKPIRNYDAICFHRGYTNITMSFEYISLRINIGNYEWGAPKEPVFIIKLGSKLNK